ncbi:MAG: IS110 family transposase [Gammaproteobacteria bacterium]
MNVITLGIDLAKNIFQLHGVNRHGKAVLTKRVTQARLRETVANIPSCLIGMEACASAHYWAREFERLGHKVKLIAPQFVKPYVKSNKNDAQDAEAICEAVGRPPHALRVGESSAACSRTLIRQNIQSRGEKHRVVSKLGIACQGMNSVGWRYRLSNDKK